jgi:VIT1/CCC1 family predicted Fe2+/Mn2+ transporter
VAGTPSGEDHVAALAADHTPERVQDRLDDPAGHGHLRDAVYGAVDGAVTTLAVVTGALGAQLGAGIVLVLGFANLAGDGFSMAVGNALGLRAEHEQLAQTRAMEHRHIELVPEGEREEVRQILAGKGLSGEVLEEAVAAVTSDHERWVDLMLTEEHGLSLHPPDPWRAALTTFVAFVVAGLVPLLPFVVEAASGWEVASPVRWSAVLTGITFALVGALRARFVERPVWRTAAETVLLGGAAASLAFGVGVALRGLV